MAKYLCPVSTCNVHFEGSVADIIPPAIGHAGGSHNTIFSDQDIIIIIKRQADPDYRKGESVSSVTELEKPKKSRKVRSNLKATSEEKKKWWERMGEK